MLRKYRLGLPCYHLPCLPEPISVPNPYYTRARSSTPSPPTPQKQTRNADLGHRGNSQYLISLPRIVLSESSPDRTSAAQAQWVPRHQTKLSTCLSSCDTLHRQAKRFETHRPLLPVAGLSNWGGQLLRIERLGHLAVPHSFASSGFLKEHVNEYYEGMERSLTYRGLWRFRLGYHLGGRSACMKCRSKPIRAYRGVEFL